MIKKLAYLFALAIPFCALAAEPAGYYDKAENKCGAKLLAALETCISDHTELSYGSLFNYYMRTDPYPGENAIWDIYSTKHWPAAEKCGSYSVIGDCYNKEHSVPKSWFNNATPMYSDLMHLYPTDGKVNGQRSNYPYGECTNGTYVASFNGVQPLGRLGKCTAPGYSGAVFEPDDEYKGDLARTYFYMAACYNSRVSTWESENFDGTNYPVFSAWTLDMLLKWHRADPLSQKEIDRNNAVYAIQGNRNPFIDHPELVEYIWGDKKTKNWNSSIGSPASINTPADGTTVSVGLTGKGFSRTTQVAVKGTNLNQDIAVTVSGDAFSCDKREISASAANAGTTLAITFSPQDNKTYTGTLILTSGNATSTVTLKGEAVAGIPVSDATKVTSDSFTANWAYVGGDTDGKYTLEVSDSEGKLAGYPLAVDAKAESYIVRDLQPSTTYTYTLYTPTFGGNKVQVTTAEALPYIEFLFDGDLYFQSEAGSPSASTEIIMATENIDTEITLSIGEPFELSVDKAAWSRVLKLSADENRFYLRMNSSESGEFESELVAETDGYRSDATLIRGNASRAAGAFIEDFENGAGLNGYCDLFEGSAARWVIKSGGFWTADPVINGNASLRFGKSGERFVALADDRVTGIGTVSFMAKKWNNSKDATAVVDVETSTDGGNTWIKRGTVEVSETTEKAFSVSCNVPGNVRLRLNQTDGGRWLVDDITISDVSTGLSDPTAERHTWDAYARDGKINVEVNSAACPEIAIYCIDGKTVFRGNLGAGTHSFDATRGQFYIVAGGDFSRTVLVR